MDDESFLDRLSLRGGGDADGDDCAVWLLGAVVVGTDQEGMMAPKDLYVYLDLRANEFANVTIAELLAFADQTGHELHIEFVKPAPAPGPKKGRIR